MATKSICAGLGFLLLSSCAGQPVPINQSGEDSAVLPNRAEALSFFSGAYQSVRDAERGVYGLLYGLRDGTDSFIYDVQKNYYDNYQK